MSGLPFRFRALRAGATVALTIDVLAGVALVGYSIYLTVQGQAPAGVALGAGAVLAVVLGLLVYCAILLLLKSASNSYRMYDSLLEIAEVMRRVAENTRTVADNSTLSEWAKRVIYREKDYEYLRDTIQGAIVREDWESAAHLIDDLERDLGYKSEADRLRAEVEKARLATVDEKINAALERFELLCAGRKWEQAAHETQRLHILFPHEPRITNLSQELELRRQSYKRHLLRDYEDAVRVHDVDTAHKLLFQLDRYLSPQEAATLKESARSVFKEKLEQMRVEFSLAVSDKRYEAAVRVGQQLVAEFPNTRYAQEINERLPMLRRLAVDGAVREGAPVGA